jgi:hypothetical protein
MQTVVRLIFIMLGATCVGYLWAGGSFLESKPPLLGLGLLLIVLTAGLAGRSRASALLARAGLGAALVAIAWTATRYLMLEGPERTEGWLPYVYVLGMALGTAGIVALFLLVRRLRPAKKFRLIDVLPLAGAGVALALGILWLAGDDSRLRPCRLGDEGACDVVAGRLLEAAEREPAAPPTRWQEHAARALDAQPCRSTEPGACAIRQYAIGTVALRAGRFDAARDAFLRACEEERNWCVRAMRERALPWTAAERARLERRP